MRMTALAIFMFFLSCAAMAGNDAPVPEISASVSPAKSTVGSLIEYRIAVTGKASPAPTIVPPEQREYFPDAKTGPEKEGGDGETEGDPSRYVPLYVIHSVKKEDRSDQEMTDITVAVQISFYRPGTWALPDIEIRGADGMLMGYATPRVEISATNEKGEFQEIEPPLELSGNHRRLVILVLALAALATVAFFAWRRIRRKLDERRSVIVVVPPIETFLKEIEALGGPELIEDGRVEEFVFGISMIFRKFLSSRFRFDATEMTSHEIERKIRKALPRSLYLRSHDEIMENLNLWDLSKFAEFTPAKERLHASLAKTVELAERLSEEGGDDLPRV